ncbi:hypothetical protein J6590_069021 [Homalodisca vitripennis]|nr:hypothetical protein J6590_069021 [Homalodisca vitripennis]
MFLLFGIGGVEECKRKWSSIRDQLRRTLQKRKTKSGQASVAFRKYKYEDILSFLVPFLGEREGITNVFSQQNEEEVNEQELVEEKNLEENTHEQPTSEDENTNIAKTPSSSTALEDNKFIKPKPIKRKMAGFQESGKSIHYESPSSQLMAFILAEKAAEKRAPQQLEQHPVDAFLAGIAPSLKSLNPELLIEAKGKIFNIVQEIELKQVQFNCQGNFSMGHFMTFSSSSSTSSATRGSPIDETSNADQEYLTCKFRHVRTDTRPSWPHRGRTVTDSSGLNFDGHGAV